MKYTHTRSYLKNGRNLSKIYHRFVFGMNLPDLIDLIGVEAACKLLKYYSGTNIYLPRLTTIQKTIKIALIREEAKILIQEGESVKEIDKSLAIKYKTSIKFVKVAREGNTIPNQLKKEALKNRLRLQNEINNRLLELVREHREIFKSYGIL